jgi:YHS domain-containing protein
MLIRLLILAVLIFFLFRMVRSLFPSSQSRRTPQSDSRPSNATVSDMVQDPHCGVYVAKKEAFSTRTGNGLLYFCSQECCKKYLEKK